jgi:hypothetical protein
VERILTAALALTALALTVASSAEAAQYSLAVHKAGTGKGAVSCEVWGTGKVGPCAAKYPEETELVLYAEADPGSVFVEFSEDCSFEECELLMDEPHSVTATFEPLPQHPLTVYKAGTGKGTVECEVWGSGTAGPCASSYPEGTELVLYAEEAPGSEFEGFSGDCEGLECELEMSEPHMVIATFVPEPSFEYALTIATAGTGSGTVSCDGGPCAPSYPEGAQLSVAATPAPGSSFAGFQGGGCSGAAPCQLTLDQDVEITATFQALPPSSSPTLDTPKPPGTSAAAVVGGSAKVRGQRALVKVICNGPASCMGRIDLYARVVGAQARVGSAPFSLRAGQAKLVGVRLSTRARSLLRRVGRLKVRAKGTGIHPHEINLKSSSGA